MEGSRKKLVYSVVDRCKTCYTCVRECPAKAIRIVGGQAEIIAERCIACGNCVRVCSQGAKAFYKTMDIVLEWINEGKKVVAIVAPSFPAEFMDLSDHQEVVGMIRKAGFYKVHEVSFGADLVARRFKELISDDYFEPYITSDCPAIVSYVKKYQSDLVENLAPVCSPMTAMARVVRKIYDEEIKIVFIGPCIAKKNESDDVDEVITFRELRQIFLLKNIDNYGVEWSEFDGPLGGVGSIFPVSRGLIQAVDIDDKMFKSNIIAAEGRYNFQEALREFKGKSLNQEHLELLCCDGCIMGAGMTSGVNRYAKGAFVSKYVKRKLELFDEEAWKKNVDFWYSGISLDFVFEPINLLDLEPSEDEVREVLKKIGKVQITDELNCGACGYDTCYEHAVAIIKGLAEEEMCLPYAIEKLHQSIEELNVSNLKLANAQQALKQSEKLASMGQLSAGIAHELNNPLGVIIMYSNILLDEQGDSSTISPDLKLIVEQAERCKKIVGGLLNFARKNQVNFSEINLREFVHRALQSVIIPSNIEASVKCNVPLPEIKIDEEQMMQVITNLIKNAVEAMSDGGKIMLEISEDKEFSHLRISDTGSGISKENLNKIFEPFFTTKPIGKGTGLGLATAYGIIKMHKGKIEVQSNDDPATGPTGTTFILSLPKNS